MSGCPSDATMSTENFLRLCELGALHEVRAAIEAGADVNARRGKNGDFRTALMYASSCNSKAAVVLVENGADVHARNKRGMTALMYAARSGKERQMGGPTLDYQSLESITALLRAGADVNARDNHGQTALMFAARNNWNPKVFSALLEAGADITAQTWDTGMTALMWAAERGKNAEIIPLLLKAGADPKQKNKRWCIALDFAEYNHALRNSDALLQLRSVSLYREAADYMRRLDRVEFCRLCGIGTPQQVKAALDAESDVSSRDHNNRTPLIRAAKDNTSEVVRLLLDAGAEVNEEYYGMFPLMLAVMYNKDVDVLRVLIEKGAYVNAKHRWTKKTALFYAVRRGRAPVVVKLLIDAGADVNAQADDGNTPLMYAIRYGSTEVVKLLIDSGVDVNAKNKRGKTPLELVRLDSPEILELLTKAMENNSSNMNGG